MPRAPLAVLVSSLVLVLPLAGCGGDDPTEPSPIPCSYTLSPANRTVGSEGGTGVVTVTTRADCGWTAASNAPWVSITGGSTGKGPGSVSYAVTPNTDQSSRSGTIAIAGLSFSIVEDGRAPCTFDVTPQQQNFAAGGGNGTVAVATASSCSWTAATTTEWLTIVSGSTGQGNGTVSYTVAPHTATIARSGSLTVGGVQVSWITITTSMPHQGDDRVFFTIAPNMTGTARTGTITVRDKVIRINQGALDSWAGLYSVSTFLSPNFSIRYRIWSR